MWKTYGFPVHKCYTNGGLIPHRTVSLQKIRRVFVIPLNEIPLNVGNQNWFCVARPEKPLGTPPGFHHWLQLSSKPYDWCHCCCFFGCILIWASSWFKLFGHFGPSNDALSIGRLARRRSALQAGKLADGDDTPLLDSNRVGPCRVMSQGVMF